MILNNKIGIKTKTNEDLGYGNYKEVFTLTSSDISASVQPLTIFDIYRAGRKIDITAYKVYLKSDIILQGDDRIVFLEDDYSIISKETWQGVYIKLFIEEIK